MNRRQLLRSAGLALAAGTAHTTHVSAADPSTIAAVDCQSHLFVPEVVERMRRRDQEPTVRDRDGSAWVLMEPWNRKILPKHMDVDAKLADMDAANIQWTLLSANDPGPEWFGSDCGAVARSMNNFIGGIVRKHENRFFGLCVLPWPDQRAARAELLRCVEEYSMKGILLYTNLAGRFPDEPPYRSVFAWAEELGLPVLLHPAKPVTSEVVKGYEMISALGNMFDNTIALTRILLSGILDDHPRLKLVCPHLGGTLPYIIGRVDHQTQVLKRGPKNLKKAPSEYLKQVWFDIVSPLPAAMRFAVDYLGTDRLLFASDHPWVDPRAIREHLTSLKLPQEDMQKILRTNALTLFQIP